MQKKINTEEWTQKPAKRARIGQKEDRTLHEEVENYVREFPAPTALSW